MKYQTYSSYQALAIRSKTALAVLQPIAKAIGLLLFAMTAIYEVSA